ncbi:class I SAM-dependent methyltransferase [Halosimplex pelagicum]|uniref:Class I SAM-dependent methyltransferase n=1 Tax=Halosimplex pelagicum TaxID=869886 RepID=A0A7D5T881_9EURY|nr:class I SAM-dependent methyltransferase [Halosimplex pelagicum]QLH80710.1 class I SAM-dependent methyltransferase [Halosimplex pelagicum]
MDDGVTDELTDVATPETGDALGAMLREYHRGGEGVELIERDDGWIGISAGGEFYFAAYDEWPEPDRRAVDRVEGRVLDVGCGAGRAALYLQERGHDVTAIDVSPGAVEVARDRGVEDARVVDVADVADEFDPGTFDTVLMLGNNFGLAGTAETAPDRLRDLATVATDDATLVAQSRDPVATDDEHHLAYHEMNRERGRLPGALRMRVRHERLATPWFDYLMAAPDTMAELAGETPWNLVDTLEPDEGLDPAGGDYVGILEIEG